MGINVVGITWLSKSLYVSKINSVSNNLKMYMKKMTYNANSKFRICGSAISPSFILKFIAYKNVKWIMVRKGKM